MSSKSVITIVAVVFLLILSVIILSSCGYFFYEVQANEIGIKFKESRVVEIVPPGRYTEFGLWLDMKTVKVEGLQFCASDPEVLTKDQQRLGLEACGTVIRPGMESAGEYADLWGKYRTFLMSDEALIGPLPEGQAPLMSQLTQQAMKVCVGDRPFSEAAVGAARDTLRQCIDEELSKLATPYGLNVQNIVVPNIALNPTVQALLDQITDEKFKTDLERQQALRAAAEAERKLAEQQGQIKVEQGRIQEQRRQEATTAALEREALEQQMQVIVAQKANELKAAQLAMEVSTAELEVAQLEAKKALAEEFARAGLFADNPAYAKVVVEQYWAEAWKQATKVVLPAGVDPMTVLSPDGGGLDIVIPAE